MRISKILLSTMLVAFALAGCRGNGANDSVKEVQNTAHAQGNQAIQAADYASACESSTLPNIDKLKFPGVQTVYHLSALEFSKKIIYYADTECKDVSFVIDSKGTLDVRGKSTKVANALDEDFKFEATTVTIQNDTITSVFNALGICGYKDWAKGTEKNVTADAEKLGCPGKSAPRTAYEIVMIENGNLLLGANTTKEVELDRPIELDRSKVYIRR